jgi:radical SAM-linked protein
MGWKIIKLYFMIGLPTETDEDIAGIEHLIKLVRKKAKDLNFNISVSPFVPKAQTAFQWSPMTDADEIKRKINLLNKLLPVNVKAHNFRASILESLIAKGDRRLSSVIYKAWLKGAKFDQWSDKFVSSIWDEALAESEIDLNFYAYRNIKYDEILPWDHLNFGMSKETLYKEYIKGINETVGITAVQSHEAQRIIPSENYAEIKISAAAAPVVRLRLRFSKKGVVRFVSHLEQVEVFRRTARRSGLPIAFTAGFSPQVKSSYGPPLSVGQESSSEYMELYFMQKVNIENVKLEFSKALPDGFRLLDVKKIPLNFPAINILSNVSEYKIKNVDIDQEKIDKFLSQDLIIVKKTKKGKTIEIDAKPLIKSFKNESGDLKLQLRFSSSKSVRPETVLKKLLENQDNYNKIYDVERINLYIETKNGKIYEP